MVARASSQDTSLVRCSGHVLPVAGQEDPGHGKGLCLSSGMGTPQDPPGRVDKVAGEGILGYLLRLPTRPRISGRR